MELSPQSVASTTFKIVKKGYDPDEVRAYLTQLATAIEQTQSQATAMEARARAAVVRLQEIAAQSSTQAAAVQQPAQEPRADEAETISRTLLLAQRTADNAVAEARAEAAAITESAHNEARQAVTGAQEQVNRLIEEAKSEARRAGEGQRIQVESEVQALLARREFLLSDVDYLEQYIVTQRDRLRDVATALTDIVDKVPGGLGDMRRPLVSAAGDAAPGNPPPPPPEMPEPVAAYADPDPTQPLERVPDAMPAAAAAEEADEADAEPTTEEPTTDVEATPSSGATQFLFEDVTAEVPTVTSDNSRNGSSEFRVAGDELN